LFDSAGTHVYILWLQEAAHRQSFSLPQINMFQVQINKTTVTKKWLMAD
jgi:hypothetical protein